MIKIIIYSIIYCMHEDEIEAIGANNNCMTIDQVPITTSKQMFSLAALIMSMAGENVLLIFFPFGLIL